LLSQPVPDEEENLRRNWSRAGYLAVILPIQWLIQKFG
jgi:hypothetical protein